jgi:hypothetical protein
MTTPFSKERYSIADFRNALTDIKSDIETTLPLIDKADLSSSADVEMQMLLMLSGLEIKMTNFAQDLRKKLA